MIMLLLLLLFLLTVFFCCFALIELDALGDEIEADSQPSYLSAIHSAPAAGTAEPQDSYEPAAARQKAAVMN